MKKILLLILLFSFLPIQAQLDSNAIIESSSMERKEIDLSGKWNVSYDDGDSWVKEHVPSTSYENKSIIYKKSIKLSKNELTNRTYHIQLDGISDNGEFYINNQSLGSFFGGMTKFWVDIPESSLKVGNNEIKIIVNPAEGYARQIQQLPLHIAKAGTGIIRRIKLISTASAWVNNISSSYKLTENGGSVALKVSGNIVGEWFPQIQNF